MRIIKTHKRIERLSGSEYSLLTDVLAAETLHNGWPLAWIEVADNRLSLADAHLSAARILHNDNTGDEGTQRSVISRAYYAMFCAARAALSLDHNGDVNTHDKFPNLLNKATNLGPTEDRQIVSAALAKF